MVEIIFGKKDMSKKDVEDAIRQYTDGEFTILEFDNGGDELRVIVGFTDKDAATEFVGAVKNDSCYGDLIKTVGFVFESLGSLSPTAILSAFIYLIF